VVFLHKLVLKDVMLVAVVAVVVIIVAAGSAVVNLLVAPARFLPTQLQRGTTDSRRLMSDSVTAGAPPRQRLACEGVVFEPELPFLLLCAIRSFGSWPRERERGAKATQERQRGLRHTTTEFLAA